MANFNGTNQYAYLSGITNDRAVYYRITMDAAFPDAVGTWNYFVDFRGGTGTGYLYRDPSESGFQSSGIDTLTVDGSGQTLFNSTTAPAGSVVGFRTTGAAISDGTMYLGCRSTQIEFLPAFSVTTVEVYDTDNSTLLHSFDLSNPLQSNIQDSVGSAVLTLNGLGLPTGHVVNTDGGGDYSSLASFMTAVGSTVESDLSVSEGHRVVLSGATTDTADTSITTFTNASASNKVELVGDYMYKRTYTGTEMLSIDIAYTDVSRIRIANNDATANIYAARINANEVAVHSCIISVDSDVGSGAGRNGIHRVDGMTGTRIYNNLVVGMPGDGIYSGTGIGECEIYNNTVINSGGYNFNQESQTGLRRNNVSIGATSNDYNGTDYTGSSNNASSDTTGSAGLQNIVAANEYVDFANGDYRLKTGSSFIGAGADLSSEFTEDMYGDARTGSYTLGHTNYFDCVELSSIGISTADGGSYTPDSGVTTTAIINITDTGQLAARNFTSATLGGSSMQLDNDTPVAVSTRYISMGFASESTTIPTVSSAVDMSFSGSITGSSRFVPLNLIGNDTTNPLSNLYVTTTVDEPIQPVTYSAGRGDLLVMVCAMNDGVPNDDPDGSGLWEVHPGNVTGNINEFGILDEGKIYTRYIHRDETDTTITVGSAGDQNYRGLVAVFRIPAAQSAPTGIASNNLTPFTQNASGTVTPDPAKTGTSTNSLSAFTQNASGTAGSTGSTGTSTSSLNAVGQAVHTAMVELFPAVQAKHGIVLRNADGSFDSLFAAGNKPSSAFQLPTANYVSAKMGMTTAYPRPDGETQSHARHRYFHSSMPYRIPIGVQGGAWPFKYEIITAPTGATIGSVYGDTDYGILQWTPSGETGSQNFTVRVTDQGGSTIDVTWTSTLDDSAFIFIDPSYAGTSTGTITQPLKSWADWYQGSWTDSTYANKIIVFRGGNYTAVGDSTNESGNCSLNTGVKTPSLIGYPGETPIIDCAGAKIFCRVVGGATNVEDITVIGIRFENGRADVANSHFFWCTGSSFNRHCFAENYFYNMGPGTSGTDNNGCIFISNTDTAKNYGLIKKNTVDTVTNASSTNGMYFEAYWMNYWLIEENIVKNSNSTSGIFLKATTTFITCRANEMWDNNTGSTITVGYLNSNSMATPHDHEVCWNNCVISGVANTSTVNFDLVRENGYPGTHYNTYVYRNTFQNGYARVRFLGAENYDTEGNIIVSDSVAADHWDESQMTIPSGRENVEGNFTGNTLTEANGELVNGSPHLGTKGHKPYGAS